jgi:hypothetical protein
LQDGGETLRGMCILLRQNASDIDPQVDAEATDALLPHMGVGPPGIEPGVFAV